MKPVISGNEHTRGGRLYRRLRADIIAWLVFGLAALCSAYPVLAAPRTKVLGWLGDNVLYVYYTGWVGQALLLGQSPLVDPRLNYPHTLQLTANDAPFLSMLLTAPVTWTLGPVLSYNLILVLSSFLSGYLVYCWIRRLTGSRAAGMIAGLAFQLVPYRIVHSYGHLNLISTQALPLFFWSLDHALATPRPGRWALLGVFGATFLVGASSLYYLAICLTLCGVYLVLAPRWGAGQFLRSRGLVGVAVGLGAILGSLPALMNLGQRVYRAYPLDAIRLWSATPWDFLVPSRLHPIWGAQVERLYPRPTWIEHTLYLGVIATVLATFGLLWQDRAQRRRAWIWGITALTAAIFALGTDLHLSVDGQPLQAQSPVWLPSYYLSQLPVGRFLRGWSRFAVITNLMVALLAGLGTAALLRRFPGRRRLVTALCLVLLVIDFAPWRLTSFTLEPRPIDRWLAQQPGDFAVAFLPAGEHNYVDMYGSLVHAKHLPGYAHSDHLPEAFQAFTRTANGFPREASIVALRNMGFRYVILDQALFAGQTPSRPAWADVQRALAANPQVQFVTTVEGLSVWELRTPIPAAQKPPHSN